MSTQMCGHPRAPTRQRAVARIVRENTLVANVLSLFIEQWSSLNRPYFQHRRRLMLQQLRLDKKTLVVYVIFIYMVIKWHTYDQPGISDMHHTRRKVSEYLLSYNFTMLPDSERCKQKGSRFPLVVVTVLSIAKDYDKRQAIRQSWASPINSPAIKRRRVVVFFMLSNGNTSEQADTILNEQYEYRDLIVTDLPESYENLVQKVHACLTFHLRYCSDAPFLLKVDDDVAVHPDRVLDHWIWDEGSQYRLYCSVHNNTAVIRNPFNKWYVSKASWTRKHYPAYCNGPFYMMGREAVRRIAEVSRYHLPFVMEDVFYTGVVAGALRIPKTDWANRTMNVFEPGAKEETLCNDEGLPITVAYYPLSSPEEMLNGSRKLRNSQCSNFKRFSF